MLANQVEHVDLQLWNVPTAESGYLRYFSSVSYFIVNAEIRSIIDMRFTVTGLIVIWCDSILLSRAVMYGYCLIKDGRLYCGVAGTGWMSFRCEVRTLLSGICGVE